MVSEHAKGTPRFRTVAVDVDSTLAGIEGIDWLAARRGAVLAAQVRALTDAAMSGSIALDDVYAERLTVVAPSRSDVAALAEAYCASVAPGARECIAAMHVAGVRVLMVSGGLHDALLPLARVVGVGETDVYGVSVTFSADGAYAGFDTASPLYQQHGKAQLLRQLIGGLDRPILHVGDGMTDAIAREVTDGFAAFTGFVSRPIVVARADFVVDTFGGLQTLVLG